MSTQLPPIDVVGQRAPSSGGGFPPQPGSPDDYPPHQNGGGGRPTNPCENPVTALEWNADAAAAEAWKEIQRRAPAHGNVYSREWGAVLYIDTSGHVQFGNVTMGPEIGPDSSGSVTPDYAGIDPSKIVGWIHTHPGTGAVPSGTDWQNFDDFRQYLSENFRVTLADQYRIYMVGRDFNDPHGGFEIRIYNNTLPRNSDNPGPKVNPDGQPCPN